jgi:hypothetical protein
MKTAFQEFSGHIFLDYDANTTKNKIIETFGGNVVHRGWEPQIQPNNLDH